MKLAKQHLDVGLFTNNEQTMLDFWQNEVGLAFEETLPLGGGVRQHRHSMNGSVLKLNAARALRSAPRRRAAIANLRSLVMASSRRVRSSIPTATASC